MRPCGAVAGANRRPCMGGVAQACASPTANPVGARATRSLELSFPIESSYKRDLSDPELWARSQSRALHRRELAELSRKRVRVIPSRSLPQGIAALFAFDFSADLEANASAMSHALSQVQTIEVTHAVRASEVDGLKIAENDVIGLLDDRIVESGPSPEKVVQAVLKRKAETERSAMPGQLPQ